MSKDGPECFKQIAKTNNVRLLGSVVNDRYTHTHWCGSCHGSTSWSVISASAQKFGRKILMVRIEWRNSIHKRMLHGNGIPKKFPKRGFESLLNEISLGGISFACDSSITFVADRYWQTSVMIFLLTLLFLCISPRKSSLLVCSVIITLRLIFEKIANNSHGFN